MKKKTITSVILMFTLILGLFPFNNVSESYAEETEGPVITIDGDVSDWNYIKPLFMGGGGITKASAFVKDGMLYGKMEVSNASQFDTWHVYLNVDNDNTNHLYKCGADYIIETDIMYCHDSDNDAWEEMQATTAVVTAERSADKGKMEFMVPVSDLGNPETIGINFAEVSNWTDVAIYPSEASEYATVPEFEEVLSETMEGLTENEVAQYLASKEFSGTPSQWDAISYDAVNKDSNLKNLKAVSDGTNLYISALAKKLSNNFTVYVSTKEELGGTDKSSLWPDGSDIGYELKSNGTIYRMKGNKKVDSGTVMTDFYMSPEGFEIAIPLEYFGENIDSFYVAIDDEGEILPDTGKEMLKVTLPLKAEDAPVVTPDGDDSDWKNVKPIGYGEGSLGNLYAFRTNDALYVMTYIEGVTDPDSSAAYTTSLFIDADNNDRTGFLHSGYGTHHTGDFLMQDWNSFGPDRNLEFFYTNDSVILEWNMKKQYVEGYEKVFAPTGKAGEYCAEYVIPMSVFNEVSSEISDDLRICIDRNDCQTDEETYERKTPEGFTPKRDADGSFALVPKYGTTFALSFKDFDLSDWDCVCNRAVHENKVNLSAVKTDDKLFTMITAEEGLSTDVVYYISTEEDGYAFDNREDISYVIISGKLYPVSADNTLGEAIKTVYQYYSEEYVLMQMYLDNIGNPSSLSIAADAGSGLYVLPNEGMLKVTSKLETDTDENLVYLRESNELFNNPYKGWVGWADINEGDIDDIAPLYNLVYVDFKWSELEPEKGKFSFDEIEEQYQFEKWKQKGCRMVLRFVMDNPNLIDGNPDIKRMDIPEWLYKELEEENAEGEGAGVLYNGQTILELLGGVGFSPNYKSEKLLAYHENVVKALAERYDDPALTAYVEVGSLGHWAEFHTWPTGTGEFPDPKLAQEYMQPYADYFKNVKVGIRKPYELSAVNNWGLYNDIFGVTSDGGTPTFLEWAATGNTDMPGSTEEDIAASAMPDWWKLNFSGGEFANGDFRTNAEDENVSAVLGQIRDSHTTWLGPCSACDIKHSTNDFDEYAYNIEVLMKQMGYRYTVKTVTKNDVISAGSTEHFDIKIQNDGVAPIYYDCPVTLSLTDKDGKVVAETELECDTREWLPGITTVSADMSIPSDVEGEGYSLYISMATADDLLRPVFFANENTDEEGKCFLYSFNVSKAAKAADADEVKTPENEEMAVSNEKAGFPVVKVIVVSALAVSLAVIGFVIFKNKKKKGI